MFTYLLLLKDTLEAYFVGNEIARQRVAWLMNGLVSRVIALLRLVVFVPSHRWRAAECTLHICDQRFKLNYCTGTPIM